MNKWCSAAVSATVIVILTACRRDEGNGRRERTGEPGRAPASSSRLEEGELGDPLRLGFGQSDAADFVASRLYGTVPVGVKEPAPISKEVLLEIRGYEQWPAFPENLTPIKSSAHRRTWVVARYNDIVERAMSSKTPLPLPDGSVIVKEQRVTPDSPVILISTMSKRSGKWYWVQSTTEGQVLVVGGEAFEGFEHYDCYGCHKSAHDNDEVFTHEFSK